MSDMKDKIKDLLEKLLADQTGKEVTICIGSEQ